MLARTLFSSEHDLFRDAVSAFVDAEITPNVERWEEAGVVDRELFIAAGAAGFLGIEIPAEHGGGGVDDFRFNVVLGEEVQRVGAMGVGLGLTLHNDICLPYFTEVATPEQQARWLPGIASGEKITAVAMTEPGTGSDLNGIATTAIRDGDDYIVNGSKTFITNGINADLIIVAAKTDPEQGHRGMSLLIIEEGMAGFERGRNLSKIGMHAQDTAELFFTDVRVPAANLLGGTEGRGFFQLMENLPRERLSLAVAAAAHAKAAFTWTVDYCKERKAFGQPIGSFQHSKFTLAEMKTELDIAQVFLDRQTEAYLTGELTADDAAEAKWWCTDLENRVVDHCLQLHGGYGYMEEYPIARAWRDARVQRIYGGTNEIMKEIIGRSLGF